jgi:cytolysin-activating lysine-acyltransferase
VLDPLLRNRVAIAEAKPRESAASSQEDAPLGIAIWAKVSPEVDAKIREQIGSKVFPIRLKPADWASGEITWLLDVIAPNPKLATAVLAHFRQTVREGHLLVHPIVRGQIDTGEVRPTPG